MSMCNRTVTALIVLALWCSVINGLPPSNDLDASIAKLFNGYGVTLPTVPGGFLASPPQLQTPDTPRPNFGFGGTQQPPYAPQQPRPSPSTPTLTFGNGTATGRRLVFSNLDALPPISTNECQVFLGIPYAAPPVDQLRFKGPKPPPGWTETLDATKYKSACMQDSRALPKGWSISEDCLHLNIFKPAVPIPVPIVIWIHGGAFLTGSATTLNPTTVCRQVIVNTLIVITLNYRLGAFGFPAHSSISGTDTNLGLRDIAQAVKWVQDNAMALGGQSNNITLVGHGGGAALVSHLLDSGLINLASIRGAILMSGSGMAPWAITRHSWQSTARLLNATSCSSMECLQTMEADRVFEKAPRLWSPYVDNVTITAAGIRRMDSKRMEHHFPVIMGFTMQEGTALAVQKLAPVNGQPLKEKITRSLVDLTGESKEEVERRYLYERATPIDFFETIFDFIDALSEAYSDMLFKLPSIKEATARTQRQSSNVYVYAVRHDVPLPGNTLPGYKASYHGSDLDLFWSPYAKQSRVNLLGAFLQVIWHQNEKLPWHPWSPDQPVILQITPYGGQFITFRPPDLPYQNQSYPNTTARYGSPGMAWTASPPRKFTLINSNSTPFPFSFGKKKTGPPSPAPPLSPPPSTSPSLSPSSTEPTTTVSVNDTSTIFSILNRTVVMNGTFEFIPTREVTTSPPNTTVATSTKSPSQSRGNSTAEGTTGATNGQQDSLVWVLLGLAVLFLFLFLITVGGCAAWNRQSYHPHPNRRSRHQGAKVRSAQRVPPPVAPLESSSGSHQAPSHQPRSQKNSEGKQSGRRMVHQSTVASNNVGGGHRRPRQPPPSLPPLLGKDPKRN